MCKGGSFVFTLMLLIFEGGNGSSSSSFFDLEEVEGFHFSVNFLSDPLNEDMIEDPPSGSISVPMRNNQGQPFRCLLPSPEALASEITEKPPPLEVSPNLMKDVMALLDPLKDHPCLKRSEGYWVYELCYGQYIKQYHTQDNKPVGDIILLGNYDFDYSEKEHNKNKLLRHYSQYYINGSICDELGTPRKAEVRYVCDPATPSEVITNVEEPALCEYILTVKTSRTCSLPQMRPTPKAKQKTIDCFPLLSSGQFSDYMERKAKKAGDMESTSSSSNKIMNALSNDKLSDKLIDEIVTLVQSSVSDTPNPENPLFTAINAQKYLDNVIDSASTDKSADNEEKKKEKKEAPAPEEDEDVEAMIKESSELMKKMSEKYSPEDLSKIMDKIQKGAESNVDEIIKETAEDFKMYLKPLKKAEAAQVLTNSLDTLMTRIKSAIKNVDKGIQDIEDIIKEDKGVLEELEESLDAGEDEMDDEASTDNVSNSIIEEGTPHQLPSKGGMEGKHDGKRSVKKDLSLQEGDENEENTHSENEELNNKKALDDFLSSVQSKINEKMGSVTVKVVSASTLDSTEDLPSVSDEEDMKYYSRMMYESMAGNRQAYEDIKKLRRDRKGYMFKITVPEEESVSDDDAVSASKKERDEENDEGKAIPQSRLVKIPIRLPSSIKKELPSKMMENVKLDEEKKEEKMEPKDLENMKPTKLPVKMNTKANSKDHRPKDDL